MVVVVVVAAAGEVGEEEEESKDRNVMLFRYLWEVCCQSYHHCLELSLFRSRFFV